MGDGMIPCHVTPVFGCADCFSRLLVDLSMYRRDAVSRAMPKDYLFLDITRGCGDHIYQHDGCPHCTNNSAVVDTVIRCLKAEGREGTL